MLHCWTENVFFFLCCSIVLMLFLNWIDLWHTEKRKGRKRNRKKNDGTKWIADTMSYEEKHWMNKHPKWLLWITNHFIPFTINRFDEWGSFWLGNKSHLIFNYFITNSIRQNDVNAISEQENYFYLIIFFFDPLLWMELGTASEQQRMKQSFYWFVYTWMHWTFYEPVLHR